MFSSGYYDAERNKKSLKSLAGVVRKYDRKYAANCKIYEAMIFLFLKIKTKHKANSFLMNWSLNPKAIQNKTKKYFPCCPLGTMITFSLLCVPNIYLELKWIKHNYFLLIKSKSVDVILPTASIIPNR